jgi:hypothetical protein
MRNMLAFLAATILAVGGLGWYLDWYKVASRPIDLPGHTNVSIDINTTKIGTDVQKGEQKIQKWLDNKAANNQAIAAGKDDKSPVKIPVPHAP